MSDTILTSRWFVETINRLQEINRTIDGVLSAPPMEDYDRPDSFQMPLVMTFLSPQTNWVVRYKEHEVIGRFDIYVLIEPLALNSIGQSVAQATVLLDAFRSKYLSAPTYTLTDPNGVDYTNLPDKQIIDKPDHQAFIAHENFEIGQHPTVEFPRRSQNWYTGLEIGIGVYGTGGGDC